MNAATALSASRFGLAPLVLWAPPGWRSAALWLAACGTDLADGWLARRTGTVSTRGARMDALADFVFLITEAATLAIAGVLPMAVPAVAVVSFTQFWFARGPLRYDPIGKYSGSALYAVTGIGIAVPDEAVTLSASVAYCLFTTGALAARLLRRRATATSIV